MKTFFKKYLLSFVVFLTGGAVLIIELAATRILSPYFGNTIFTVSSIISVILGALSLGYYFGGRLADRRPSLKLFFSIILFSGACVIILKLIVASILPKIGYAFSTTNGPLTLSLFLFFFPSLLLGTLSPFAAKLQEVSQPESGIGKITGGIFFWSTLGSIAGSLLTGFFLIPHFGVAEIIGATGLGLTLLGLVPLFILGFKKKNIVDSALLILLILGLFFISQTPEISAENNIVFQKDGVYEKITIYNNTYAEKPALFLKQDRNQSAAMFLESDELVFDYTKYYSLYKILKPDLKEALFIGGGAYSMPKALLAETTDTKIDVSEIEPSLFDLGKKYFRVPDDPRLENYLEDGRRFLHDSNKKYDLIFSDVYFSFYSVPSHFTTKEFFEIAKNKLSDDGIFLGNFIGSLSRAGDSLLFSEIKTFQTVFPNSYFFAVRSPSIAEAQNIIFLGWNSDKKIDFNDPLIKEFPNEIIKNLSAKNIDISRFELSKYKELTDNHSPTDYLTGKFIKNLNNTNEGDEMLAIVSQQLRYGPRFLSSPGHEKVKKFIVAEMSATGATVKTQTWEHLSADGSKNTLTNIIGQFNPQAEKRILLGTHYDSKKFANLDKEKPNDPMPGANDSASGTAVLLELARYLANQEKIPEIGIDLVFFDGEEGEENLEITDWRPLGSEYFAEHLDEIYKNKIKPAGGIIVDLVCDKDLKIKKEPSSLTFAPKETNTFWELTKTLNLGRFSDETSQEIRDDHTALNKAGIPTFLIIDFDYPYFHTTEDTEDKCSAISLETIFGAVVNYIYGW